MRWASYFLGIFALSAACVVEDKPVDPMLDGGVDAGLCGGCPDDRPICTDELDCVQCTADADDYCSDRDLICNTATNECVECLSSNDCASLSEAVCNTETGECEPCTMDAECNDKDGFPPSPNVCDDGTCVDCSPETQETTCPDGDSCNAITSECSGIQPATRATCENCESDVDCGDPGTRCVPMTYGGEPFNGERYPDSESGFCLKSIALGGSCENPYRIVLTRVSLSGAEADDYCGINEELTTCEAVLALLADTPCDPENGDADCPEPAGLCRELPGMLNRCTYLCSSIFECLPEPLPGWTCDSGPDSEDYCGGQPP